MKIDIINFNEQKNMKENLVPICVCVTLNQNLFLHEIKKKKKTRKITENYLFLSDVKRWIYLPRTHIDCVKILMQEIVKSKQFQ